MGTWSIPWESLDSAKQFADRMSKPWLATVSKKTRPDFGPTQAGDVLSADENGEMVLTRDGVRVEPIGETEYWDWEAEDLYELFGDDSLFDELGQAAEDLQKDFDVRESVINSICYLFEACMVVGEDVTEDNLEAVNVCRQSIGLPPLSLS